MRYICTCGTDFEHGDEVYIYEADTPEAAASEFADGDMDDEFVYVRPVGADSMKFQGHSERREITETVTRNKWVTEMRRVA